LILRRFIEHVKHQNWTAIALDFVIVVMGVFIGLQVQEWSKRRDDRQREAQIIGDFLADLEIDRAQYANGLALDIQRVSAANASLKGAELAPVEFNLKRSNTDAVDYTFDPSNMPEFPESDYDRLWTSVVIGFHPTPSTSTYEAIVGAGDIRLIRDRQIVKAIQQYRNDTVSIVEQNEKLISLRQDVMNVGAIYGLAPFARMPAHNYFALVANEPRLAATIRIQATFTIYHYGEIRTADAGAAELQSRLKKYLEEIK